MNCTGTNDSMTGCGGRLCRACRPVLKKYRLLRYPLDAAGTPCTGKTPTEYTICGFTAASGRTGTKGKMEIPGTTAGNTSGLRLTIIGHTCEQVLKGDRIEDDGMMYRVAVVQRGNPAVAVLVPVKSGGLAK